MASYHSNIWLHIIGLVLVCHVPLINRNRRVNFCWQRLNREITWKSNDAQKNRHAQYSNNLHSTTLHSTTLYFGLHCITEDDKNKLLCVCTHAREVQRRKAIKTYNNQMGGDILSGYTDYVTTK